MLQAFLLKNRSELIKRCNKKAAKRSGLERELSEGANGVPILLEQIAKALLENGSSTAVVYEPGVAPTDSDVGLSAAAHGVEMLHRGYSIDQVVHEYGDLCQAITELAEKLKFVIKAEEFRTLNRCLDNAIADAVVSYGRGGQILIKKQTEDLDARIADFSREQGRLVEIASSAFAAIRTGNVGPLGATGNLLAHTLAELQHHGYRVLEKIVLDSRRPTDG